MKNILVIFILFFASSAFAQEDRFSDINQIKGKDIYVIDNSALTIAYSIIDGKLKPIRKIKNLSVSMAGKEYSVENDEYIYKKDAYVVLKGSAETILLKEEDSPLYLSSFISKTYWQEKFDSYRNDYAYLNFKKYRQVHSESATTEYDDLSRIEWRGLEISDKGAIYYMCEYKGIQPLGNFKVTSRFFEESKDLYFIKKGDIQPYVDKYNARIAKEKREKEIEDSLSNCKIRLAKALDEATFDADGREIKVYRGDTMAIFSYKSSEDKYVARFRYANLLFVSKDIEFLDTRTSTTEGKYSWERKTIKTSADADYLKAKGEEGKEQRFLAAADYDDAQTRMYLEILLSDKNRN